MKLLIMICAALTAAIMTIVGTAGAWSYSGAAAFTGEAVPGEPVVSVDARTLALGGSSLASAGGVFGTFYNPAALSLRRRRAMVSGIYFNRVTETAADAKGYASSSFFRGPVFGVMQPLGKMRLGAGYRNELDMGYSHEHKSFSSGQADTFKKEISGGVNRAIIASSVNLFSGFNAGLSVNILGGEAGGESIETLYQDSRESNDFSRDFSGNFMEFAMLYEISRERVILGFNWSPKYIMKDKWSRELKDYAWDDGEDDWGSPAETSFEGIRDIYMPEKMGLGIEYNFTGIDGTMITADLKSVDWSSYRYIEKDETAAGYDQKINPGYRDTISFSVGVQHFVNFLTAVRAGFSYEPFYGSTASDMTSVSVGAGLDAGENLVIDIGGKLGMRSYNGPNPFTDTDETVTDTLIQIALSMEWLF